MKHLQSYQQFNEGFDLLSKVKDYLTSKLQKISLKTIEGIKSDLIQFTQMYNLTPEDMKDKKKVEAALLKYNENFQPPYPGYGQIPGPISQRASQNSSGEEVKKSAAKWVVEHPILHKLSKLTFLLSILTAIGQGVGLYFTDTESNLPVKLVASMVATIIVGLFLFLLGKGDWSMEYAKKVLDERDDEIDRFGNFINRNS